VREGSGFTWAWIAVGVAAVLIGVSTAFGEPRHPLLGAAWVVLGLLNILGAWRRRALSRGNGAPR
jgi:hypothetical protein